MIFPTIVVCIVLLALAVMQTSYVLRFARIFQQPSPALLEDPDCPEALVVMCVRGKDPHLQDCLASVSRQDYPNYRLKIIVDNQADPAMTVAKEFAESLSHVETEILQQPLPNCSLKCSSLVQGLSDDSPFELIAFLDSDTIPEKNWLRALASGLNDEQVGVVSGVRWYEPPDQSMATVVRFVWNAAAVVQMVVYQIAWGGTLAMGRSTITQANLLDYWSKALCEDTMLRGRIQSHGLQIAFQPNLFIVNRESCGLKDFRHWLTRQLLTARLYHPSWYLIVLHSVGTTVTVALTLLLAIYGWLTGQVMWASVLTIAFFLYQVINVCLLNRIISTVRQCMPISEGTPAMGKFQLVVAGLIAQTIYFWSTLQAMTLNSIQWRGIRYQIGGPWNIQMSDYQPYQQTESSATESL